MHYKVPQVLLTTLLIVGSIFPFSGITHASGAIGQYVESRFSHLPHNLHSTTYLIDGRVINNPIDRSPNRVPSNYDYIISPNPYYHKNQRRNNITPYHAGDKLYYGHTTHTENPTNNLLSNDLADFRYSLETYIDQCSDIHEDNTNRVFDCLLGDNLPLFNGTRLDISPLTNNLLFVMWIEHHTEGFSNLEAQEDSLNTIYNLLRDIDEETASYYHINLGDLITILETILDSF